MHPMVAMEIARSRGEDLRRRADHHRSLALVRHAAQARRTGGIRLALAGLALRLAQSLDPSGQVALARPLTAR